MASNALIATASSQEAAPAIVAQRLRKGPPTPPAALSDWCATRSGRARTRHQPAVRDWSGSGADRPGNPRPCRGQRRRSRQTEDSVAVRLDAKVKAAIAAIGQEAWTTIAYPNAVFDEPTSRWISSAEVAEIALTGFTSNKKTDQMPAGWRCAGSSPSRSPGQDTLLEQRHHYALFTTRPAAVADTVATDEAHRGHAIIEQVDADLMDSALPHMPSGRFTATWLVVAVMPSPDPRRRRAGADPSSLAPPLARSATNSSSSPPGRDVGRQITLRHFGRPLSRVLPMEESNFP